MSTRSRSKITPKFKAGAPATSSVANSTPQPLQPDESDVATAVVKIIAEEVGLEKSEVVPSTRFTDLGVDSLLSLNIASRLREELGLDVDGSLFVDCPTVFDLVRSLNINETPPSTRETTVPPMSELDSASQASDDDDTVETSLDGDKTDTMSIIRRIVAEEVGILETELTDTLDLNELGMDSLLSLAILGRLRDSLEINTPASLFADNSFLNEIEAALSLKPQAATAREKVSTPSANEASIVSDRVPMASSVLLQGSPRCATKTLSLFPDGSGSAASHG